MFGPFGEIPSRVVVASSPQRPQSLTADFDPAEAYSATSTVAEKAWTPLWRGGYDHSASGKQHGPLNWLEARLRAWRWGTPVGSWCAAFLIAMAFLATMTTRPAFAAETDVRFDVPALLSATTIATDGEATTAADQADLKLIRIVIPVTTELSSADRDDVREFRYDVQWRRDRFPLVDYGPRTQTTSTYEGTIAVEEQTDRTATLGLAISGGEHFSLSGSSKAEAANRKAKKISYHEIPQQDVVVASGTTDRGTGAFFRFHRSRQQTLEGNRDLTVTFRVPKDWRAGLLRVVCEATGSRKVLGIWDEPLRNQREFLVPVYLEGDRAAQEAAVNHVRKRALVRDEPRTSRASWLHRS